MSMSSSHLSMCALGNGEAVEQAAEQETIADFPGHGKV